MEFKQEEPPVRYRGRKQDQIFPAAIAHLKKNPGQWFLIRSCNKQSTSLCTAHKYRKNAPTGYNFTSRTADGKFLIYGIYEPPTKKK